MPFAALAVLGALLVGGVLTSTPTARAELDSIDSSAALTEGENTVTLTIVGEDDVGEVTINVSGGEDPTLSDLSCSSCVDSDILQDDDDEWIIDTGTIDGDGTADALTITITLEVECEEDDEILVTVSEEGGDSIDEAFDCGAPVTPTVGAAATVIAQASPNTVNCNGTSIVTIQVKTAGGQAVAVGTAVTIAASIGSVSPSSGQTTSADGSVFVFYTAPANAGGAATITAKAGNAQGTATVQVNCAAQATATTAPPPPTVAPGVISPPNTGDAGIVSNRTDWTPFAGIAVLIATLIGGAVAAVKMRE
jgi:hypothetical protein